MAQPTPTVPDYLAVLTKSRLLPPADVAAAHEQYRRANPDAADADVDAFRKYLVGRRLLTEYQAVMVQRGHADGFSIGGYTVLDRIGKGQTAGVYKAVHASGQLVALKVLAGSKAKNAHLLGRFQREGRLLTQLDHPNVVRAFQVGNDGGVHYIAMEFLEGETLDDVLTRRKQLPAPEAVRLVHQALLGLQHVHEQKLVHRDLKPANLMVCPADPHSTLAGTVKILDIGLGRELFDDESPNPNDLHLTTEGTVLGTPDYLAPEQARDARGADVRADIYSLGCVLFHLVAGRPPFQEKNVMATMVKHATEPPPGLTAFAPGAPPGLGVVLNRLLAKDPGGRYATPVEAAEALKPYLPADAAGAAAGAVLPEYRQYLDSESGADLPIPAAAKPGTAPAPVLKPGTAPAQPLKPGTAPAPALKPPAAAPQPARVPVKSGTVQVGGFGAAQAAANLKPPSVPPRPGVSADVEPLPEIDVELIAGPEKWADVGKNGPEEPRVVPTVPPRALYDLDRRDFVMLTVGAGGVIGAILAGFGAARMMRKRVEGDEEERPNQP